MGFGVRRQRRDESPTPRTQHLSPNTDGVITAIEPQVRGGGTRANVFVDGRYAFSLAIELAAGLRVGSAVDAQTSSRLLNEDQRARVYDAALRFLGARPRSEREIRARLAKHQFAPEMVDGAIERLRRIGLVDDAAFAEYWVEQRQTHRPRGGRLLKQELRAKGIDVETAAAAIPVNDDADDAYRAAQRKAHSLRALDERTFKQRLGGFLQRRGFDYETTRSVVARLLEESGIRTQESGDAEIE
jgi:regulatory protein